MASRFIPQLALLATLALLVASPALASPDAEGSSIINSVTCGSLGGVPGCDDADPLYTVTKSFQVYADDNPDNPAPTPGNFTYIYTIANDPTSTPNFGEVSRFEVAVPANGVTSASFIDGAGIEPTSIETGTTVVRYRFEPFGSGIPPAGTSEQLLLISPYGPGEITDTMVAVGSASSVDTQDTCVGPVVAPPPLACTIGFWKNREDGKKGLLKFFEGADFDAVKAEAVAISSVFASEAELIGALTSKGNRTVEERAKQQLAALLLNVAAGTLFPSNTKCRLFLGEDGTQVDLDGDGTADATLEALLTQIESDILSGDPALQGAAQSLADDINNGIGVIQATMFQ